MAVWKSINIDAHLLWSINYYNITIYKKLIHYSATVNIFRPMNYLKGFCSFAKNQIFPWYGSHFCGIAHQRKYPVTFSGSCGTPQRWDF